MVVNCMTDFLSCIDELYRDGGSYGYVFNLMLECATYEDFDPEKVAIEMYNTYGSNKNLIDVVILWCRNFNRLEVYSEVSNIMEKCYEMCKASKTNLLYVSPSKKHCDEAIEYARRHPDGINKLSRVFLEYFWKCCNDKKSRKNAPFYMLSINSHMYNKYGNYWYK